jgi:hypothetical protein
MSLVAHERHYLRDGTGSEQLYDLRTDPFEQQNVVDRPEVTYDVRSLRRMLLKLLSEESGSEEVEKAYLIPFRQWLAMLVHQDLAPGAGVSLLRWPTGRRVAR